MTDSLSVIFFAPRLFIYIFFNFFIKILLIMNEWKFVFYLFWFMGVFGRSNGGDFERFGGLFAVEWSVGNDWRDFVAISMWLLIWKLRNQFKIIANTKINPSILNLISKYFRVHQNCPNFLKWWNTFGSFSCEYLNDRLEQGFLC